MTISRDDLLRLLREDPTLAEELRDVLFGRELRLIAEIGEQLRQVTQFLATSTREFDRRMEEMRREFQEQIAQLRQEFRQALIETRQEFERRMEEMRQEFRQALEAMRQEFQQQMAELRAEIREAVAKAEEARRRAEEVHAECDRRISEVWVQIEITQHKFAEVLERLDARERQWAGLAQRYSRLAGLVLELRYRLHPYGFFGEIVRRPQWVTGEELEDLVERAVEAGLLTREERRELLDTDLIVRGIREGKRTWLAVEVSGVLDYDDLKRAVRRSQLLERITNEPAIPVIAGELCSEDLLREAKFQGAWVLLDGRTYSPEQTSEN